MAKTCPNCEKENPSYVQYCAFCGTQIVDDVELNEEDKLRKKLAEQKEQMDLLIHAKKLEKEKLEKQLHESKIALEKERLNKLEKEEELSNQLITITENIPQTTIYKQEQEQEPEAIYYTKQGMFSRSFSFEGRIRRTEYWLSIIIYIILSSVSVVGTFLAVIAFFPLTWFIIAQGAKRCHDRDNSGWFQIIPFYGLWMLFAEGDYNANRYGNSPK